MKARFDRNKSLQELEGNEWGEPMMESALVTRCHLLRRKFLKDFTVEDLRIMIGQNIGLPFLVPLAIEHLQGNPLVEGDFFPGDLLVNVLRIKRSFWKEYPHYREVIEELSRQAILSLEKLDAMDQETTKEALDRALREFERKAFG